MAKILPTRSEPLPVPPRKGESRESWAGRVMEAWFRIGQPPLKGSACIQVQQAQKIIDGDKWYTVIRDNDQGVVVMNTSVSVLPILRIEIEAGWYDETKAIKIGNLVARALNANPDYAKQIQGIVEGK